MKLVNHSCASESNTFEFSGVVQRNVQEHSRRLRPEIFSGRGPVWVSRSSSPPASPGRAGPGAPGTAPWVPPPPPDLRTDLLCHRIDTRPHRRGGGTAFTAFGKEGISSLFLRSGSSFQCTTPPARERKNTSTADLSERQGRGLHSQTTGPVF